MFSQEPVMQEQATFIQYWNTLRNEYTNIMNFGSKLWQLKSEYTYLLNQTTDPELINKINERLNFVDDMFVKWQSLTGYIKSSLSSFKSIAQSIAQPVDIPGGIADMGQVQIVIPVAIITSLTYIITTWSKLVKDYIYEQSVLDGIKKGLIKPEDVQKLVPEKKPSIFENIASIMKLGLVAVIIFAGYRVIKGLKR